MKTANFEIVDSESSNDKLVIRDLGPWEFYPTITNSAEEVIEGLYNQGLLLNNRKLFYYDSENKLDELVHENGNFICFKNI